jgi:UDP-glucose 4-epimerase
MIVVTGGLGFIGSHTSRALLDRGESCLLVQRRGGTLPGAETEAADKRLVVAQADLRDRDAFLALGRAHRITGIVHLAGSVPWPPGAQQPVAAARDAVGTLLTVVQAAVDWGVPRVTVASTIGVYAGIEAANPLPEELPLSMSSPHVIPAFKKVGELLTDHLAGATGVEIVNLRISAVWGPLGRPTSPFTPVPQLVHAAAHGTAPDLSALATPAHSDDGGDLCYVKDCGRAIALLQTAPTDPPRTSTSTPPACAKTPATSPGTTPTAPSPTTWTGCAPATRADQDRLVSSVPHRTTGATRRAGSAGRHRPRPRGRPAAAARPVPPAPR